ncbi:hypothetical protein T4C_1713, partial [Trichinella pseudospiralis]
LHGGQRTKLAKCTESTTEWLVQVQSRTASNAVRGWKHCVLIRKSTSRPKQFICFLFTIIFWNNF